jgi:PAS domain S-box-containing protein
MPISIRLPIEQPSAGAGGAAPNATGEPERLTVEFFMAALQAPWQGRGWAGPRGHQLVASVPALLRILNAENAQRLALQEMTEREERFRQLVESMSDVFWIYEPQGTRFLYVSPAYEREWMRSAKALYADPRKWLSAVHSDDRQLLQDAFDHLDSGDSYALEYRVTTTSGEERWISERAFPVASQSGHMPRIAGVSQDVTARKKADLELFRADRRKGEFLAMLAHELRSPLEPIRSAATLLARRHVDGPVIEQKAISVIERHVAYLTRLVDDLLDVARTDYGKIRLGSEVVRLGEVIEAAIDANRTLANGEQQQDCMARWI